MTRKLRDERYALFCETLSSVEPSAPTLCDGWTVHDLAAHVWLIKRDPAGWPGMALPFLAHVTDARLAAIKDRWSYAALIDRLREHGPGIAAMPGDGFEGHRHALGEYVIHTEDIRRPNDLPPLPDTPALRNALWRRVGVAARILRGRGRDGLILQRPQGGDVIVVRGRPGGSSVIGEPIEVLLWVYGRESAAAVEIRSLAA
ncbi:maleylpyruvate isomerase family mycothiol-dependent enzyme [Ammonicoccus fulvus]|uniref:Maleylpyruvate isomerase family mycothiol-dependent enzyme n=1 Tax=Ammonicoccus fulvus TaxID=3138240 RepID=A0ABZ3FPG8_9ACTN